MLAAVALARLLPCKPLQPRDLFFCVSCRFSSRSLKGILECGCTVVIRTRTEKEPTEMVGRIRWRIPDCDRHAGTPPPNGPLSRANHWPDKPPVRWHTGLVSIRHLSTVHFGSYGGFRWFAGSFCGGPEITGEMLLTVVIKTLVEVE